jgi:hypothetical protein
MVLEDITGKTLSAVDVFTLSIKALVDHLLSMFNNRVICLAYYIQSLLCE